MALQWACCHCVRAPFCLRCLVRARQVSALFAATPSATTFHSLMKELPRYSANEHLFAHYSEQVLLACHLKRITTTLPCGYRAHSQDAPPPRLFDTYRHGDPISPLTPPHSERDGLRDCLRDARSSRAVHALLASLQPGQPGVSHVQRRLPSRPLNAVQYRRSNSGPPWDPTLAPSMGPHPSVTRCTTGARTRALSSRC
jgi:hypothetical protein